MLLFFIHHNSNFAEVKVEEKVIIVTEAPRPTRKYTFFEYILFCFMYCIGKYCFTHSSCLVLKIVNNDEMYQPISV